MAKGFLRNYNAFGVYMNREYTKEFILITIDQIKIVADSVIKGVGNCFSLSETRRYDIKLVINELLANCFRHAKPSLTAPVIVNAYFSDGKLSIRVTDNGKGFEYEKRICDNKKSKEVLYKECGRGLILVDALCQEIKYNGSGNSVEVKIEL